MRTVLKRNRSKINQELHSYETRKYFSPVCYAVGTMTSAAILAHLRGKCIDIGCGDMPFRTLIEKHVSQYDSLDIEARAQAITYIADIQNMKPIEDNTYDSGVCLEVLEHIPDPFRAVAEIHRILKKGAKLICSVPHLSRLHEEPHDYYRFTIYGLRHLFEYAGFRIVSIEASGGIFSFLGHQLSALILLPVWHIPVLKQIGWFVNKWLIVKPAYTCDRLFDKRKIFALGYICVVEKK